jgi:hypothetical protein
MRNQGAYNDVFSSELPIEAWPALVDIYKKVDVGLANVSSPHNWGQRFINNRRPLTALIAVAQRLKTFAYTANQLVELVGTGGITNSDIVEAWNVIAHVSREFPNKIKIKNSFALTACEEAANKFGLAGREVVCCRNIRSSPTQPLESLSPTFVDTVESLLPPQPWKVGVHIDLAKELGCKANEVSAAIQHLIADGKRYVQREGVVYDSAGKVLMVDSDRIRPEGKPVIESK